MSRKLSHLYSISRNYVRCEVLRGDADTKKILGRSTLTPDKGLTRAQRKINRAASSPSLT